jgi:hypothetical protein
MVSIPNEKVILILRINIDSGKVKKKLNKLSYLLCFFGLTGSQDRLKERL